MEFNINGLNNNSLIMQWNTDTNGNPTSIHIVDEIQQISTTHYLIQLAQIPDEYYRVKFVAEMIDGYLIEVKDMRELVNINNFYVDYNHGIVYFHKDLAGRLVRADYYGRGVVFLSDARIFHKTGDSFATTLDEVLEKSKDGIKLLESVGGLSQAIDLLETKADEGNAVADRLEDFISETEFYGYTIILTREAFVVKAKEDGRLYDDELDDVYADVVVYKGAKPLTAPTLQLRIYSTTNCECEIDSDNQRIKVTNIDTNTIKATAIIEIDCGDGLIAQRTLEITKVFDGVSQFNVEMTNSFYSFTATHSGRIEQQQSVTCDFLVTRANENYTGYIVGIQNMPPGMLCNINQPTENASSVTFVANTGSSLPDNGSISIVFQMSDDITITKNFVFSKTKQGLSAKTLMLAGNQIIHYENADYSGIPTPMRTSITAQVTDLSGTPTWSYLDNEEWIILDGQNGNNLILYHNNPIWGTKKELTIKCELDGMSDEITLIKIANGATGISAYSVLLSNEATTLRVNTDGTISEEEIESQYTTITAFKGSQKIAPTSINVSGSSKYEVEVSGSTIRLTQIDTSSTTIKIPIEVVLDGAVKLTKEWTISKTEPGEHGAPGAIYTLNVEGGTRAITYNQLNINPRPTFAIPFTAQLYENGNDVTSSVVSWYWSCQGHMSGTSITSTFTPEIKEDFDEAILNNTVVVTAIYNHTPISYTIPIVVTKDVSGLDWVTDWDSTKVSVRDTEVLTPKLFAGSYDEENDSITGVAMGVDVLNDGIIQGITAWQDNQVTFLLSTDGSLLIGNPFDTDGTGLSYNDGKFVLNVDEMSIAGTTVPTWDDVEEQVSNQNKVLLDAIQANIDDMNNSLDEMSTYVDNIMADEVVSEIEKAQLDSLFQVVQQEVIGIQGQYTSVINNPYLPDDDVRNLETSYARYLDAYDNIVQVYNDVFGEVPVPQIDETLPEEEYLDSEDFSIETVNEVDTEDIVDDEYLESEDFGIETVDEVNEVSLDTLITRDGYFIVTKDGETISMVTENTLLDFRDAVDVLRSYSSVLQQAIAEALLSISEHKAEMLVEEAKEEVRKEVSDVNSALNNLETTMNGEFKSGLIGEQSKAILKDRLKQLEVEKNDVDGQYQVLHGNTALDATSRTSLGVAKANLDTAHDLLVAKINQVIIDNLMTDSELEAVNEKISEYAYYLQEYSKVAQECNGIIAQNYANLAVESITDEDVFNKVTNYGVIQGLFLKDEKVYINSEYINTRNFKAVTDDGKETFKIDENGEVSITAKSLAITGSSNLATQDYVNTQIENITNTNVSFTLSNEFQIIPTDESYYPLSESTYSINVKGYLGSSEEITNFTIGSVSSSNGITAVVSNVNKTIVFTVSPDTPLDGTNGYIDIPITYGDREYNKRWSWAVSKQGNQATYVTITGEQFFKYSNNYTGTPTPNQITLTANVFNSIETGKWQYQNNGTWVDWKDSSGNTVTTKNLTIYPTDATLATTKSVFVRYYVDSVFDTYTIACISDGENGNDAQYITVTGGQTFKYSDNYTGTPTPSTITLTATAHNVDNPTYQWSYKRDGDTSWTNITGATSSKYTLAHDNSTIFTQGTTVVSLKCTVNSTLTDEITIVKLTDGKQGVDGKSVISIIEQYYLSTSQQMLTGGSWQDTAPTWTQGYYIWTKTIFTYSDNTTLETTPICVTGKDGADGLNGGVSVSSVDIFYYQSTSSTELTGGTWSTDAPTWVSGKYVWSKTVTYLDNNTSYESNAVCVTGEKGTDGKDGINGAKGEDGTSYYFYIRYSANEDGSNMTNIPQSDTEYMGVCSTTLTEAPTSSSAYDWTLIKGADGQKGQDGVSGEDGKDGTSSFLHVKYSDDGGVTFTANNGETLGKWIGTYVDYTEADSNTTSKYTWAKFIGEDGKDGKDGTSVTIKGTYTTQEWESINQSLIANATSGDGYIVDGDLYVFDGTQFTNCGRIKGEDGKDGTNGTSSFLHIKYSNDNGQTFTNNNGEDIGTYIGTYVDNTKEDSTVLSDYKWTKFVGDNGADAYTVLLTNENHTFAASSTGNIGSAISTTTTVMAFKGTTPTTPTIGTLPTVTGLTLSKSGAVVTITANTGSSLATSGSFNIPITVDGKSFTKSFSWSKSLAGTNGTNGGDAYTVLLTNENHTFVANHLGVTAEQIIYTDVIAYKGATPITPTIGTLPTVTGLTLSKSGTKITIKANSGSTLADNGSFDIPITVDGKSFTKSFSWTKAKDGAGGENAKSVNIIASNMIFKSTDGGNVFSPDTIKLTAQYQNLTHSQWQYSTNGGTTWSSLSNNGGGITGATTTTINIPKTCSYFTDSVTSIVFKALSTDASFYDVITITKLYDVADVDFEGIAQDKVDELDERLNQQAVFDRLTNNGTSQGMFLEDGELYINGEYIEANTIRVDQLEVGSITNFVGEQVHIGIIGAPVGGTNLIPNSNFDDEGERFNHWTTHNTYSYNPDGYIQYSQTSLTEAKNYQMPCDAIYLDESIKEITFSVDVKIEDKSLLPSTNKSIAYVRLFDNTSSTSQEDSLSYKNLATKDDYVNNTWTRVKTTIENIPSPCYIRVAPYMSQNGVVCWRKFKLETGIMATDWSPSPQDSYTSSDVDVLLNQTKESIELSVSSKYSTKDDVTSAISVAKGEINTSVSSTYATKTLVQDEIEGIQFGGRNLLRYTDFNIKGFPLTSRTTYNWRKSSLADDDNLVRSYYNCTDCYAFSEGIGGAKFVETGTTSRNPSISTDAIRMENGVEYTTSAYYKLESGSAEARIQYGTDPYYSKKINLVQNLWTRVEFTFTYDSSKFSNADPLTTNFYFVLSGCGFVGYICGMKLEKGNKASDWSPAPEDSVEDISSLQTRINTAEQKITDEAIISTVSTTFISKDAIIGGENMVVNSNFEYGLTGWAYTNSANAERWSIHSDGTLRYFDNTTTTNSYYQLFSETPIEVSTLVGSEVTLSFEYKVIDKSVLGSSAIAYIRFYTEEMKDSSSQADAVGYYNFYVGNDYVNGTWDRCEKTIAVPEGAVYARVASYCAAQGEIYWRKYQLEAGNVSTAWKASVQDAELYASSLSNTLSTELGDLSEIVSLNNGSDALTPMMKVKLVSEASDAKSIYDNLFSMYQTVGVTDFSDLVTNMVNAHMKLASNIQTMQDTITETSETGLAAILDNFNKFYEAADILNQAIINALKGITNDLSTSITQLSESVDIQINSFSEELGEFRTNFTFGSDGLTIKSSADATKYIKLDNDSLDFMDNNTMVAQISDQQLTITNAEIEKEMKIGNLKIKPSGIGGIVFVFE